MKRRIRVQKGDIEHGIRHHTRFCPVARAISRELSDLQVKSVLVWSSKAIHLYFGDKIVYLKVLNEDKVDRFIEDFDGGFSPSLISFDVKID